MKQIISMLILMSLIYSGGMLGFNFGDTYENVDKILKERGAIKEESEDKELCLYKLNSFCGVECQFLFLLIDGEERVIKSGIRTENKFQVDILNSYDKIKTALTKKYGTPQKDKHFYLSPYKKGDGYMHQAFLYRKGFKYATWKTDDMDINIEIQADKLDGFYIRIYYEETALMNAYTDKRKQKQQEDI
jgi:hypothetical protein